MDDGVAILNVLLAFRERLYVRMEWPTYALFEFADAILTARTTPSPVHLSLAFVHRRGWGSFYAALGYGRIHVGAFRTSAETLREVTRKTEG